MPINWGNVTTATTAIATAGTAAANIYSTVKNASGSGSGGNSTVVEKYIDKPVVEKDNTVKYIAMAGVGVLVVGGIILAVTKKNKSA